MELKLYRALLIFMVLVSSGYYFLFWSRAPFEDSHQTSQIPESFKDRIFHWRYNNGWDFRVEMTEERVNWEGLTGTFEGMSYFTYPHYTQISEEIYFVTWPIPRIGVDSLVLDLQNKRIFAHVKANAKFYAIEGEIYCDSAVENCTPPQQ
ncbi:MAG: hypothetical protein P8M72_07515 [Gammaproteobacteria bacterium]|nr:hypothetical protein [Gammaproteobacteria bacterium]